MNKNRKRKAAQQPQTPSPADDRYVSAADLEFVMTGLTSIEAGFLDLEPQFDALLKAVKQQLTLMRNAPRARRNGRTVQEILNRMGASDALDDAKRDLRDLKVEVEYCTYLRERFSLCLIDLEEVKEVLGSGGTVHKMGREGILIKKDD